MVVDGTAKRVRLAAGEAEGEHEAHLAKANVLIVDDDTRNLFAISKALEDLDAHLVLARSGEEALKSLLEGDFAVMLLDVHMPGLDGYETAELIRKREKSRHIPIIFLTAVNKDDLHMFRGYSAGAVDYIFKPVDPLILQSKVAVFVDLFKKTEEVKRQAELKQKLQAENFRMRTEKLLAEQALRRSEERQSLIISSLPIAAYTADINGGFAMRFISENVERICGFPARHFTEEAGFWASRVHPDDSDRVLNQFRAIPQAGSLTIEYRWLCANGTYRSFLDQAVLVRREDGTPREIFGTLLDVTENRVIQQQLAHAQKMETVGQLTGGIAHDFNNMLTVVIGSLDRLSRTFKGDAATARRIDMALQAALRCSDLTRRLLAFARRQPLQPEPIDLNALVAGMSELLGRTLEAQIEIGIRPAEDLWLATVDRAQAEAALLNLVVNARDAMPEGGRLRVETANVTFADTESAFGIEAPPGDYVMLGVSDSGCGMPPDVLERAFEPFYTTKEVGKGTGLGLSITYGFVKQSGGLIKADSQVGRGTTIRMFFPRAAADQRLVPAPDATMPEGEPHQGGGEVVLVVEDDGEVRQVAATTLRELGYQVLEAEHAEHALRILDQGRPVHLLFTDMVMPGGMNGRDLAIEAVGRRPELKVLYTSAYADWIAADGSTGAPPTELLAKPYRNHELAQAVRRALASAAFSASAGMS